MKYFLFIFSFIITDVLQAQLNIQATATATISANVVSDVVGVEKKADINFSSIHSRETLATPVGDIVNIIGNTNTYSISVFNQDILAKELNTGETIKVGSIKINSFQENMHDQILYAQLNINSKHSAGTYTAITPLTIVVNYN